MTSSGASTANRWARSVFEEGTVASFLDSDCFGGQIREFVDDELLTGALDTVRGKHVELTIVRHMRVLSEEHGGALRLLVLHPSTYRFDDPACLISTIESSLGLEKPFLHVDDDHCAGHGLRIPPGAIGASCMMNKIRARQP